PSTLVAYMIGSVCARPASFFFSSRRRHTRSKRDWSSDVCSSDLGSEIAPLLGTGFSQVSNRGHRSTGGLRRLQVYRLRLQVDEEDRKSTRLNSSHVSISYAVFCLIKKTEDVCIYKLICLMVHRVL